MNKNWQLLRLIQRSYPNTQRLASQSAFRWKTLRSYSSYLATASFGLYSHQEIVFQRTTRLLHIASKLNKMSSEVPQTNGDHFQASQPSLNDIPKTKLIFQAAEHQETYTYNTHITSITPFSDLSSQDQSLFNSSTAPQDTPLYAITTESTIFHPQGGGQPSDIGHFSLTSTSEDSNKSSDSPIFAVLSARVSITYPGQVLHIGHFTTSTPPPPISTPITQTIDRETRHLFSRLHTAGHVLGTCTRTLLESQIPNFDELKASHFPNSAACEFQGSIDGKYKAEIQRVVDELVAKDAEVRIEWWRKRDFRERGLERLVPGDEVWRGIAVRVDEEGREVDESGNESEDGEEETRIRVVNIVGSEVYPCGGTHVPGTKGCGKVLVKKISRAKGNSRISYSVD